MGRALRHSVFTLWIVACFDPLYEDGAPLDAHWVLCCPDGVPATCPCQQATSCGSSVYACGENRCSVNPSCSAGSGGGSGGGSGSGSQDAGMSMGGGTGADGGSVAFDGGSAAVVYEFCCASGRVKTCACPASGCLSAPFTACAGGACIEGETSGSCP